MDVVRGYLLHGLVIPEAYTVCEEACKNGLFFGMGGVNFMT